MAELQDIEVFKAFIDAQAESSQQFEREKLMPMYQRVANAIRVVDTNHLLFLEAGYHTNAGIYSRIEPVRGRDGNRDPLQAFAPHAYDIVVDTPQLAQADTGRVDLIFGRHGETAARLGLPMIIGEYGAFGGAGGEIVPSARVVMKMLERLKCGDTYWDFGRNVQKRAYFETLHRPIPLRIAGELIEYGSDPENLTFTCRWRETREMAAPTIIYLPKRYHDTREIRLDGGRSVKKSQTNWGVYLHIHQQEENKSGHSRSPVRQPFQADQPNAPRCCTQSKGPPGCLPSPWNGPIHFVFPLQHDSANDLRGGRSGAEHLRPLTPTLGRPHPQKPQRGTPEAIRQPSQSLDDRSSPSILCRSHNSQNASPIRYPPSRCDHPSLRSGRAELEFPGFLDAGCLLGPSLQD